MRDTGRGRSRKRPKTALMIRIALLVGLCAILIVLLMSSISRGKENNKGTDLNAVGQSREPDIEETETEEQIEEDVWVDDISITGLTKEEARKKVLQAYSWDMKLLYNDKTESLQYPLQEKIDGLLEQIYSDSKGGTYTLELDDLEEQIKTQVEKAASNWDKPPINSQLTGRDKKNNQWIYSDGEPGIAVDREKAIQDIISLVQGRKFDGVVQISANSVAPSVPSAQAKQEYKVISQFETTATNNQNRNNNINLAVQALDGLVLLPGEEFSFNKTTGNRTLERGYKPAGAYRNGKFVEEPGGGVCQVSSTLYNAMIFAGIDATERHAHSFEPAYVTPGEDAMVSYDGYSGPDLRFVNREDTSVAIRAVFENRKITISIVGKPILEEGVTRSMRSEKTKIYDPPAPEYEEDQTLQPGQEVEITKAVNGTSWKTYLITSKAGTVIKEDYFHTSTYKGKPGVLKRNTSGVVIPTETLPSTPESSSQEETPLPEETVGAGGEEQGGNETEGQAAGPGAGAGESKPTEIGPGVS
ncbi:MAG: VanW family protein [Lacrimispora sp.]|uniref:VanW family protein n=1 Tax=Lacrimispora sp. TaxID=2719234 RepID=UPI0039E3DEE7